MVNEGRWPGRYSGRPVSRSACSVSGGAARGLGLGRRLLADLECRAADGGARVARLETNRTLTEALGLCRASGYREVTAFNDEPYAHHWFEKTLDRRR
jgi:hypothetical protein